MSQHSMMTAEDMLAMGAGNPYVRVIDTLPPRKMYVHVWAKQNGVGKSRLGIDAVPPIFINSFDARGSDVAVMQSANKEHVYASYFPIEALKPTLHDYKALLTKFEFSWAWAIKNAKCGTIVIDTATQLKYVAEVAMLTEKAAMRKNGKPLGIDYADVNLWWGNLLQMLDNSPLNAVFISKGREIWEDNGKPSGMWEAKAHEAIMDFVHISGELRLTQDQLKEGQPWYREFIFDKNRFDPTVVGKAWPGPINFQTMLDFYWPVGSMPGAGKVM